MTPTVACKQCGFEVEVGLRRGYLSSFSPDQAGMKTRCKMASAQDFDYECPGLTQALLTILDDQPRLPAEGLHLFRLQQMRFAQPDGGAAGGQSFAREEPSVSVAPQHAAQSPYDRTES